VVPHAAPTLKKPQIDVIPAVIPSGENPLPAPPFAPPFPPPPAPPAVMGHPAGDAHPAVKLRMGSKLPPVAPPPVADSSGMPEDLFPPGSGAPLMPLPGLPSPGMPPPPPSANPAAARPPGTVPISGEGGAPIGINPLMPMPTSGTRPPMPLPLPAGPGGATAKPAHKPKRDMLVFLFGFIAVAGVLGGAYVFFTRSDKAGDVAAQVKGKLEQAAELPGKVVANAKEGIAEARSGEQSRVDAVLSGNETPERSGVGAVSPAELEAQLKAKAKTEPVATPVAKTGGVEAYSGGQTGGVTAVTPPPVPETEVAPPPPPPPSARLVRYAEGLSVSGVFQGTPARALVNGRLIRSGEVIEPNLGVSFVGVEPETRHLILQEQSGAQVRVRY
jgi:hypothetical protein